MFESLIVVSHKSIKYWNIRFGKLFSDELRKRRRKPKRAWHIDEMYIKIQGKNHYLWRALDAGGIVPDVFVSKKRNKDAALKFFSRLYGNNEQPKRVTTYRLRLYYSVVPETFPKAKHVKGKWLNNCIESAHIKVREW